MCVAFVSGRGRLPAGGVLPGTPIPLSHFGYALVLRERSTWVVHFVVGAWLVVILIKIFFVVHYRFEKVLRVGIGSRLVPLVVFLSDLAQGHALI